MVKKSRTSRAIIKDVQLNPVTDEVIHIDFNRISLDKEIEIKVKVLPKGEAVGVKRDGGTLEHLMWEWMLSVYRRISLIIWKQTFRIWGCMILFLLRIWSYRGARTKHDPESVVITVAGSCAKKPAAPVGKAKWPKPG